MKKLSGVLLIVVFSLFAAIGQGFSQVSDAEINGKVADLLSKMTVEEKIGQMTQISLERMAKNYPAVLEPLELDPKMLREVLIDYHVGSLLNVATSSHSVDRWHEIITQIQDIATKETRLGIPVIYGIDAIHGASYTKDATLFPQSIGMAATWNVDLIKKNGEITAYETRASGIPWNFNPVLGVGRQPLWSRLWETFGEDPYLVSRLGAAYVKGLEGENKGIIAPDKVASCAKHYLGYSFPLSGKDRTPAWIPDRMLREYFVPPFKAAINTGSLTIMANSSEINGIPVHSSYYYLTELLRNELGFKGFVVSDWLDIKNLHEREKVAASHKEAVKTAVMAGIDMSMVPLDFSFYDLLLELVKEGSVPESRIDEAVSRILKVKFKLGLFDNPYPNPDLKTNFASDKFTAINLQAARESMTLLKNNDQILPLSKETKVLVTGPTADKLSYLNGGWTITWQGDREDLYPQNKPSIFKAIQNKIGAGKVTYLPGTSINKEIDVQAAVKAAKKSDVAVVCLGEQTYCETPGNISNLKLPPVQLKLVKAISQLDIPIILVLVEGRARIINEIVDDVDAILMAYLPGMEGGRAVADVIFGDCNPSGKLPITYPRSPNDLTLYDHKVSENVNAFNQYNPQFPFGFGLSYTTFKYKDLKIKNKTVALGEPVGISVTVENAGNVDGKEVVQLYLRDLYASITPSEQKLVGFQKIFLKAGESKIVHFILNEDALSFIGRDNKPVVEAGEFRIKISDLTESFMLK